MQPSEVRERVLHDHVALRELIERMESLARQVVEGRAHSTADLCGVAERLLSTLLRHMDWEDRQLVPVLAESDAWGPERARQLSAEHLGQREQLGAALAGLGDRTRPATELARSLLELAHTLLRDMEEEESAFLDPGVLRDDVVGIDVETG